jgi:putative membrane protein
MMWWGTDHWFWGIAMMILFWGLVAAVIYAARSSGWSKKSSPSARELLDRRFARGDLSVDEYERRREALDRRPPVS